MQPMVGVAPANAGRNTHAGPPAGDRGRAEGRGVTATSQSLRDGAARRTREQSGLDVRRLPRSIPDPDDGTRARHVYHASPQAGDTTGDCIMRIAMFGAQAFERTYFERSNAEYGHELIYLEPTLCGRTVALARDCGGICVFVNDRVDRPVLEALHAAGTNLVTLRCAGFNNVDLAAADELGIAVLRVPAYSPHAIAEHTVALILSLNRRIHRSVSRVREQNFSLDGLLGFDLHGKTVGLIGTGRIGALVAKIMHGFGCRILAHDRFENPDCLALGAKYVDLETIASSSDIVSLHCPLTPETQGMIDADFLARARPGLMLVNTSRGALIDTRAVIKGLKNGVIGLLGLDVYEEESHLFFRDLSDQIIQDDTFARLMTFPNVIITAHQAFLTHEAVSQIAATTLQNITDYERGRINEDHQVTLRHLHS
jgi:D-lactate dehydrogenase